MVFIGLLNFSKMTTFHGIDTCQKIWPTALLWAGMYHQTIIVKILFHAPPCLNKQKYNILEFAIFWSMPRTVSQTDEHGWTVTD